MVSEGATLVFAKCEETQESCIAKQRSEIYLIGLLSCRARWKRGWKQYRQESRE